jgi:hypothetical protein
LRNHESGDTAVLLVHLDTAVDLEALLRRGRADADEVAVIPDLRRAADRWALEFDDEVLGALDLGLATTFRGS